MNKNNLIRIKNEKRTTTTEWLKKHSSKPIEVPTCEFPEPPLLTYEENQAQIDAIASKMLSEMKKPPEEQRFAEDHAINEEIKENLRVAQENLDEARRIEERLKPSRRRGKGLGVVVVGLATAAVLATLLHTSQGGISPFQPSPVVSQ